MVERDAPLQLRVRCLAALGALQLNATAHMARVIMYPVQPSNLQYSRRLGTTPESSRGSSPLPCYASLSVTPRQQ
jgi:hypothetical protein